MHDLPSVTRIQQVNARPVSGEELETLGKQAASKYVLGAHGSLNEAVVETVKSAGLSPEQVRRVVEFANTDAFLQEFKKEGEHKVVEFPGGPADYSEVIKDLNDGGGGTVFDANQHDYDLPPPDAVKLAHANADRLGVESTKLAEAFHVQEQPLPFADPLKDAFDMKTKLSAAYDSLTSDLDVLEVRYFEAGDRLFNQVKQAALGGVGLGQVIQVWQQVTDNPAFVKAAFQQMTPRLLANEVFRSRGAIGESLMKTASVGVVNMEHPLVKDFDDFCLTLSKLAEVRAAREEVTRGLEQIGLFLKEAQGGWAGKGWDVAKKVWRGAKAGAEKAAPYAEAVGREVGGETAGKVLGGATKYAPHIALGLAGEEAYQRVRYNPAFQTAKNFAMSRVPYTRQNLIRQYSLQH